MHATLGLNPYVLTLNAGKLLMSGVPGSRLSSSLDDIQDKFEESIRVNVRRLFWPCTT